MISREIKLSNVYQQQYPDPLNPVVQNSQSTFADDSHSTIQGYIYIRLAIMVPLKSEKNETHLLLCNPKVFNPRAKIEFRMSK